MSLSDRIKQTADNIKAKPGELVDTLSAQARSKYEQRWIERTRELG